MPSASRCSINLWRVEVSRAAGTMKIIHDGTVVTTARVGTGTDSTPTPVGLHATYDHWRSDHAVLGDWTVSLTTHSPQVPRFDGKQAVVAIHGWHASGGSSGSVSHGCIRVARRLADAHDRSPAAHGHAGQGHLSSAAGGSVSGRAGTGGAWLSPSVLTTTRASMRPTNPSRPNRRATPRLQSAASPVQARTRAPTSRSAHPVANTIARRGVRLPMRRLPDRPPIPPTRPACAKAYALAVAPRGEGL